MGSQVSAGIANLYIENFEQQALRSCLPDYTHMDLKQYNNNTFIITTGSTVNNLLMYMNSQQQTIHFSNTVEDYNHIAIFDTLAHQDINNHLVTSSGVHQLQMTMTSFSLLNVSITVAEEVNA